MKSYDSKNIFAKILSNEIACKKVLETEYALAFQDIKPQAPIHVLVIPKGSYVSIDDFLQCATSEEIQDFWHAVGEVARKLKLTESGYRVLTNSGPNAHQEVMHFHVHILGGRPLGPMLEGGDTPLIS
ncbi:MAG: histidine triad nucleotide-binding protein [Rhodospirillaceae bacterium]|nr:histidine triad nucleotide-binding protein [Rhodospirillaceae bacterium]|tara:strand:- start:1124 stop:1507 length:384 start_codon:yes stop_codon:yes gene_type:complete